MVELNGNFTYCRCRGKMCNDNKKNGIRCFSTPSTDTETESLYHLEKLRSHNFFKEENLLNCPPGIKQCYYYGKSLMSSGTSVIDTHSFFSFIISS